MAEGAGRGIGTNISLEGNALVDTEYEDDISTCLESFGEEFKVLVLGAPCALRWSRRKIVS